MEQPRLTTVGTASVGLDTATVGSLRNPVRHPSGHSLDRRDLLRRGLIFGVITLSLYKLIPITLTLPGIAGFMLSIGMAVDSNILIFERFKEEKLIRSIPNALEVSFGRAWDSIRDANIATLVTCFILWNPLDWSILPSSGPVRGFAITLALGIAISLFTGLFVSRNLLRVFITDSKKSDMSFSKSAIREKKGLT